MSANTDDPLPKLLSVAVHELRTPISVAAGYLRMLLREQSSSVTDKQRKMLEEAERACGRLDSLVTEMSDLGKLESGEAMLAKRDVDIAGLLAELASGMHEGEDRGLQLEVRGADRPIVVTGDRTRLGAAVRALMHATLREHGDPGVIVAHCGPLTIGGSGYAMLAFAEESLLPVVTRPDAADLMAFDEYLGGMGLRLPIARRVIERHGGAVWSAATAQQIAALNWRRRSPDQQLSDTDYRDFSRKRATTALRLPLRT
jgi:signal transduction histidine kinase